MYLGMQNYISMLHANNLRQYVMISPVWESILRFRTAQLWLFTHKDSRVRKVPEYTAKCHTFYLWKSDIFTNFVTILQKTAWWYKADNAEFVY